jgi:hypothetical protein
MNHRLFKTGACGVLIIACVLSVGCGTQSSASYGTAPAPVVAAAPGAEPAPTPPTAAAEFPSEPASPAAVPAEPAAPAEVAQVKDDAPKPPQTKRLPADRRPRRPGEAEKITWEDINLGMQPDIVFRPFMITDRVRELEGQRVSLDGYMHGGTLSQRGIKSFVLLKNTECKFGPGGQADHLTRVFLREGEQTEFTKSPVKIEGKLVIEAFTGDPEDQNTWAIYRLDEAVVK